MDGADVVAILFGAVYFLGFVTGVGIVILLVV